jgi:hypothetical protein
MTAVVAKRFKKMLDIDQVAEPTRHRPFDAKVWFTQRPAVRICM